MLNVTGTFIPLSSYTDLGATDLDEIDSYEGEVTQIKQTEIETSSWLRKYAIK